MKRYAFKTVMLILIVSLLAIAVVMTIRLSERRAQFKAAQSGVKTMLQLQGLALNDGYFSWGELRDYAAQGDLAKADKLLEETLTLYPFVASAKILPGTPPSAPFEVVGGADSLSLRFGIKNDYGFESLPGMEGVVGIDAQKLLDSLKSESKIVVDPVRGRELAYSLKVRFAEPLLNWLDYVLIIAVTMAAGYALSVWVWRKNISLYETKGLESIIFLFEQTEHVSANHSRRVAALTMFLGQKMNYRGKRLRNLYTAGLLHDIGKISVPSDILTKEGPLTKQEQQTVAAHPIISARILKNFKELSHLSNIVLYHHERVDGSGYPEGLSLAEIPEESRIIAVVDVFEALVGERPYRDPIPPKEAFSTLRLMPLDQTIVELLVENYDAFKRFQTPKWVLAYHHSLEKI